MINWLQVIIGILSICFSLFTFGLRLTGRTSLFGKIDAMKSKFGEKAGNLIHIFFYTLIPFIVGIIFLLKGLNVI